LPIGRIPVFACDTAALFGDVERPVGRLVANGANNRNGIEVRLEGVKEAANHGLFVARNYAEMYFCHLLLKRVRATASGTVTLRVETLNETPGGPLNPPGG
jgi:hypothetical protein